jgi:hypothetical protein
MPHRIRGAACGNLHGLRRRYSRRSLRKLGYDAPPHHEEEETQNNDKEE